MKSVFRLLIPTLMLLLGSVGMSTVDELGSPVQYFLYLKLALVGFLFVIAYPIRKLDIGTIDWGEDNTSNKFYYGMVLIAIAIILAS